ncbi:transcription factor JAMYB-like [Oryza glaberrima]|uniref:Uncharacterized protein n=3 Tax=Oryza TaxID=4527 RepID=A0A0D3GV76_9ORYZ|nr:transcription factor JAMYB-like [Oryza glaberrima]
MMMAREVSSEEEAGGGDELRRGPWTVEEDLLLVNYIAAHGEGRWNALARCAGLKRTGKSCRLRWLNYLRPDVRRGNMTAEEQLLILELHGRWGNRWSKIAQHLPGRTDNEIKNYWRTRVQKHAKHLNCDVNSQQFKDLMRYLWMPRLLERIHRSSQSQSHDADDADLSVSAATSCITSDLVVDAHHPPLAMADSNDSAAMWQQHQAPHMSVAGAPPPTTTMAQHVVLPTAAASCHQMQDQFVCARAAETTTCCWSESESLPGLAGLYYDDAAAALPEFDVETMAMWGPEDDPWYTQMLGL